MDTNGGYRIDLVGMQTLIDKANALEQQMEDRLRAIEKRVTELHVDWIGQAAQAHSDAHTQWQTGAGEMHDALTTLREALDRARTIYEEVGHVNHGMWP
ncbi:WXG100 family type VII secretion target [Nocardia sp. CA2R105]|uniref:WXG100 family type VII secretion target n=1 Tax=Nocardia coffeae TaxID=2873381 RepID=UPI001CA74DB7|nr:WXG100 family type VII secretion target [Nocardia coffeae]MBY8860653.1 WXG100 family type VII secretion target [Nocardia coffeae]